MATIATRFRLIDDVSSPMGKIRNSVENTVKGFESMEGKLVVLNSALGLIGKAMGAISSVVKGVSSAFGRAVQDAGEYESLLASLTTATGSATEAQKEFAELKEFATKTPFDMPGVVQASVMFRNAGVEAEKLIPTISMLGDLAQGDNDKFQRMALNFMQIKSVGKATAMDLNQFAGMGVPIKQVLADMGVTGTATAEDIEEAMRRMTSAGGQFYHSMANNANTLSGIMSNLGDGFQQLSATIGNQVLSSVKQMAGALNEFIGKLMNSKIFTTIVVKVKETCNFIKNNLDSIIATMINMATVATMVGSVMAVAWAVAHWPLTLIMIAIITIIRLMFDLTKSANETSETMTGGFNQVAQSLSTLMSVMGALGSFIGGLMNIIFNALGTIWNALTTICEFIMNLPNLFVHPIQTIINLFLTLASTVLDIVSTIAGALDYLFGTKMSQTVNGWNESLNKFRLDHTKDLYHYERAEMKDVNALWSGAKSGANMGAEMGAMIDEALHFNEQLAWAGDQTPQQYKDYMSNTPSLPMPEMSIATNDFKFDDNGNLKTSVQNELKINDEFKQLLAQKAVETYKKNYAKISPNVTINAKINNEENADYLINEFVNAVGEMSN